MTIPHVEFTIDLDRIIVQADHHGSAGAIYYSDGSCWWSHHRGHSLIKPNMKCPLGGQIFMEKDWRAWLDAARDNPTYYGRHGLNALVAAHHSNCRDPMTGAPFAAPTWEPYNAAIDALKAEEHRG